MYCGVDKDGVIVPAREQATGEPDGEHDLGCAQELRAKRRKRKRGDV